jgi:hypothetical protein
MVVWFGFVDRKLESKVMHDFNIHFIGYMIIAIIYIVFAIKS